MMGQLQLAGMRAAYDEVVTAGIKRKHGVERILGASVSELAKIDGVGFKTAEKIASTREKFDAALNPTATAMSPSSSDGRARISATARSMAARAWGDISAPSLSATWPASAERR